MGGAFHMKRASRKGAALSAAAVAAAVAVVAAGAAMQPQQAQEGGPDDGTQAVAAAPGRARVPSTGASAAPAPGAALDVVGAESVAALGDDADGFARAFAAYLASSGAPARSAAVVADPEDPGGPAFYANAGGMWYECEATGAASGWAFSPVGEALPVAAPEPDDPGARGARPADGGTGQEDGPGPAPADGGGGAWVALSDADALAQAVGADAASQLREAMAGYCAAKGIGFDAASARVDASSVRDEPGGVGFAADAGPAMLDVVYANGEYGFKVV